MRWRAEYQLFGSYLLLVALMAVGLIVATDTLLRPRLLNTLESELRGDLALAVAVYNGNSTLPSDGLAHLIGDLSGQRVTIVDRQGRVIGESEPLEGEPELEDNRSRPEIEAALSGVEGRAERFSPTTREEHLFLARLTGRGDVLRVAAPLAEVDRMLALAREAIFGVAGVGLLLAILFSAGFSLTVMRPLRRVGEAARAMAAGDLSRRIRPRGNDELTELSVALNSLADELQGRLGQLEGERAEMQALIDSMSEGVLAFSDNGGLRRANPAAQRMFALPSPTLGIPPERISRRPDFLRLVGMALGGETVAPAQLSGGGLSLLATAHPLPAGGAVLVFLDISELRRLEGVRRDFVANASHELKTPLTAIRGYSETLTEPDLPPELTSRFATIIKSNADRLQRIVDDLLDLSRLEAGGWRIESSVISVAAMAREIWEAEKAEDRNVELRIEIAEGHDTVWADPAAVRQVISNLFSNALRYTPEGGSITFRTLPAGARSSSRAIVTKKTGHRWTVVEVEDTGSGIPSIHLSRIFERFYRADPARSREEGGTGLGLAIVKHLIESHGGWVEAESQVGQGTIVRFVLPGEPTATAPPSAFS